MDGQKGHTSESEGGGIVSYNVETGDSRHGVEADV